MSRLSIADRWPFDFCLQQQGKLSSRETEELVEFVINEQTDEAFDLLQQMLQVTDTDAVVNGISKHIDEIVVKLGKQWIAFLKLKEVAGTKLVFDILNAKRNDEVDWEEYILIYIMMF